MQDVGQVVQFSQLDHYRCSLWLFCLRLVVLIGSFVRSAGAGAGLIEVVVSQITIGSTLAVSNHDSAFLLPLCKTTLTIASRQRMPETALVLAWSSRCRSVLPLFAR